MTARLPFAPLEAALRGDQPVYRQDDNVGTSREHGLWTDATCALVLGCGTRKIVTMRETGLSALEADRMAVRAGWLPELIWGDDWAQAEDDALATCRCGTVFLPDGPRHHHCSRRCATQALNERRRVA